MKILIAGGTGFVGSRLVSVLENNGHDIFVLSRNPKKYSDLNTSKVKIIDWNEDNPNELHDIRIVIKLSGENVGTLWTKTVKEKILDSRVNTTYQLKEFLLRNSIRPLKILNASAIGYYGFLNEGKEVNELSKAGSGFLAEVCQANEQACRSLESFKGVKIYQLRIGFILKKSFIQMIKPLLLLCFPVPGVTNAFFPWIHLDDVVGFIDYIVDENVEEGNYNLISPQSCTHYKFYQTIKSPKNPNNKWVFFIPKFIQTMVGDMKELVLYGPKTIPSNTLLSGYQFKFEDLDKAIEDLTKK